MIILDLSIPPEVKTRKLSQELRALVSNAITPIRPISVFLGTGAVDAFSNLRRIRLYPGPPKGFPYPHNPNVMRVEHNPVPGDESELSSFDLPLTPFPPV